MLFWDKWRRKKTQARAETVVIGTNPTLEELREFFHMDIASGDKLNAATYYACMLIRCNAVAKLPIKLMKYTKKNGAEEAEEMPLYELMRMRPNPFTSAHDFIWATEFQRLEYGNAYWVMDTQAGQIKALYLLDSRNMRIMIDNTAILGEKNAVYYMYSDPREGELIYRNEEIVHLKNFASNGIEGTSIKKYLREVIENEQYGQSILHKKYENGLQDPLVVQYIGDLDEARSNKIKKKFESMGGTENAGKVVPIPAEFKLTQLETKLVNSQFFELQGLTTRKIANAFGVKSFQLNDMERSTFNNVEQQNKSFYSDTIQNVLTAYEQEMTYKMLSIGRKRENYYFNFNVDAMLRSDMASRNSAYASAVGAGWMSRAEVREKEGLPYREGTEQLTVDNGACIPVTQLGAQYGKGGETE